MKTTLKRRRIPSGWMATTGLSFLLFFVFILQSQSQDFNNEIKTETFKSIAKYTAGGTDKTSLLIEKYGYQPPSYIAKEWHQYPAVRKIEMAYEAAEAGTQGKGGKNFLALLSKDLAQKYDSPKYEIYLKPLINADVPTGKINFKHPKTYGNIQTTRQLRNQILTISKFTEGGALGGVRGVLKYDFGLSNDKVYEILRGSSSAEEALHKGLSSSKIPPPPTERIKNVTNRIKHKYPHADIDKTLADFESKVPKPIKENGITGKHAAKTPPPQTEYTAASKAKYDSFKSKNYATPEAKKFTGMKMKRGGFGGIIFGNELKIDPAMPRLEYIRWVPIDSENGGNDQTGTLEFNFTTGEEAILSGVRLEDVHAANQIIFNPAYGFQEGDGIGLAGIYHRVDYPDLSSRWTTVVHPEIAASELGWSALVSDVLPVAVGDLLSGVRKTYSSGTELAMAIEWGKRQVPETWKISDVPMTLSLNENNIQLKRNDIDENSLIKNSFITMYGFNEKDAGVENFEYYRLVPLFASSIYEIDRLNEFAKVIAVFRWAKQQDVQLLISTPFTPYVTIPSSIFVTNKGSIAFISETEERRLLQEQATAWTGQLQTAAKGGSGKLQDLHEEVMYHHGKYEQYRDLIWDAALGSQQVDRLCQLDFYEFFLTYDKIVALDLEQLEADDDAKSIDWHQAFKNLANTLTAEVQVLEAIRLHRCDDEKE